MSTNEKKKKRRKKPKHTKLEMSCTLHFTLFPLNIWKLDSTKEMVYKQTSHTSYILFAVSQFCHKKTSLHCNFNQPQYHENRQEYFSKTVISTEICF